MDINSINSRRVKETQKNTRKKEKLRLVVVVVVSETEKNKQNIR